MAEEQAFQTPEDAGLALRDPVICVTGLAHEVLAPDSRAVDPSMFLKVKKSRKFMGVQDEHRDHASPENLLKPHTVELQANRARQTWDAAGLHFEVALSGGSREECESWFVRLQPITSSSH